jgi:hypothetical protein
MHKILHFISVVAASSIVPILVGIAGLSAGWSRGWIVSVVLLCALLGLWIATQFGWMPLSRAAHIAYRKLHTTTWREAGKWAGTDDDLLDYVAAGIACEIPIFGKRSFIARYDVITVGAGIIKKGATAYVPFGAKTPSHTRLAIEKRQLAHAIKQMQRLEHQRSSRHTTTRAHPASSMNATLWA